MITQEVRRSRLDDNASSLQLTPRGRAVLKVAAGVAAAGAGASVLIGAGEVIQSTVNNYTNQRIADNEAALRSQTATTLHGTVYLGSGVNVRSSMEVNNGDDGGTPSNVRFTVGKGEYKGRIVVVNDPLHLVDPEGKDWYAFELPNTNSQTLKERARNLVYVAASAIENEDNASDVLVVNPNIDGGQVADTPIRFVDNEFHQANTNEVLPYELTATTIPDIGK